MGTLNLTLEGMNEQSKEQSKAATPLKSPSQFLNTSQKAEISSTHQKHHLLAEGAVKEENEEAEMRPPSNLDIRRKQQTQSRIRVQNQTQQDAKIDTTYLAEPDYARPTAEPREIHIVVKDGVSTEQIEEEEPQDSIKDPRHLNGDLEDMALASQSTELLNQQFH